MLSIGTSEDFKMKKRYYAYNYFRLENNYYCEYWFLKLNMKNYVIKLIRLISIKMKYCSLRACIN